jgi:hypothetical protein
METEILLPCSQEPAAGRTLPWHFFYPQIHSNIILPSMHRSSGGLFHSGFQTKLSCPLLINPMHATWPSHMILLHLIILIVSAHEYELRNTLLCNCLHASVTSLQVQIFSSVPCSQLILLLLFIYCNWVCTRWQWQWIIWCPYRYKVL